jgi:NAD(P)H-hydrate repair Nnr-like enzyme with NAD(P)H-hydrate dehydratase domain
VTAFDAAAAGACIHGRAARKGMRHGLVAGDLPPLVPEILESLA